MTMAEGDLAVTEIKFVRGATISARPPPAAMTGALGWLRANLLSSPFNIRSEERRVGKECRSRWSPYH